MQSVKDFINDLRELKDAAASHNLQPDPPHPSNPLSSGTGTSAAAGGTGAPLPPPPPPPRNLPHGWTARYDQKEKKYAYSHGVTAQEQWDFPTGAQEPPQLGGSLDMSAGQGSRVQGPSSSSSGTVLDPTREKITKKASKPDSPNEELLAEEVD